MKWKKGWGAYFHFQANGCWIHILHDECVPGGGGLPLMTVAIMVILLVIGISM